MFFFLAIRLNEKFSIDAMQIPVPNSRKLKAALVNLCFDQSLQLKGRSAAAEVAALRKVAESVEAKSRKFLFCLLDSAISRCWFVFKV